MSRETATRADEQSRASDLKETDSNDPDVLNAQVQLLTEENQRLREEYVRARRAQHRRAAIGLGIAGAIAIAGAVLFPDERTVLLALGGTGVFAGALTYFLAPEQFIPASVGERIYSALADNQARMAAALGLQDDRVYVPRTSGGRSTARLFIPQHERYAIPSDGELQDPFVVSEDRRSRGLALSPTGEPLFDELQTTVTGELATDPGRLGEQIADAVVETFELADAISMEIEEGRMTAAVSGSSYGDLNRFDHPIGSVFATALAVQLSTPVELSTRQADDGRAEFLVTCRWGDRREASR